MNEIRNCQFAFQCPRSWDELEPMKNPAQRHCTACMQTVYLCRTPAELMAAIRKDWCVAVDVEDGVTGRVERLLGDAIG